MSDLPALRTPKNLERMSRMLDRGGNLEKSAVLQVLDQEVALTPRFATGLRSLLYGERALPSGGCRRLHTEGGGSF